MKKLGLSLLVAGAMAMASTSAWALDTGVTYDAFIVNGFVDIPVGQLFFSLDADYPGLTCRYELEWANYAFLPLSGDCFVDEYKVHGHRSCVINAAMPIHTSLTLSQGTACYGFDKFQQYEQVLMLVAGEDGDSGEIDGTVLETGAATGPYGFEAEVGI